MEYNNPQNISDNNMTEIAPQVLRASKNNVLYMLRESNAIEGVFGKTSLTQARRAWDYVLMYDSLNTQIIKETHRVLMKNQPLDRKYKGDWRDVPVYIGGHKKDQSKIVIDSLMRDWCQKINTIAEEYDPIKLHLEFEGIHPFADGNGRMGRILMNWLEVKKKHPLIIFTNEEKYAKYYPLFQDAH